MNEVYVVSAVRTAIGTFGGSLKDIPPAELASRVTAEAVRRASVAPADIGHVVFGQVVQTEPRDVYVSRVAAVDAGIPVETPALTVNRLCGSGLQAIVSAAQSIKLGDCDVAVAGGVESMSRAPFQAPSFRWGTKMGSAPIVDVLDNALRDPFHRVLMGVTAENVAERHGITRDDQDALALESHRRASTASKAGYFKEQILGIEVKSRKGTAVFDTDEHIRHDATAEDFKGLRPVFKRDGGSVTAGNASGINDGAAAVVLASEAAVGRLGLETDGAAGRLCPRRRRAALYGSRPHSGDPIGRQEGGARCRRHGYHRIERGIRRASLCGVARTRFRWGESQSERQRDFARPSGRRYWRHQYGQGGL